MLAVRRVARRAERSETRPAIARCISAKFPRRPVPASTSRTLLEIDADDARWSLAVAQVHTGELEQAWHTLNSSGAVIRATTPGRTHYLLELTRRFAGAERVACTALDAIKAFPDDHEVHAAALNALTLGPVMYDLAEGVGGEISAAWSSFIERYPDSRYFSAYALREGENPFAKCAQERPGRRHLTSRKGVRQDTHYRRRAFAVGASRVLRHMRCTGVG